MTRGGLTTDAAQSSHDSRCRSVPHKPARWTRIFTSSGPTVGSGRSISSRPGPALRFTKALMDPILAEDESPVVTAGLGTQIYVTERWTRGDRERMMWLMVD